MSQDTETKDVAAPPQKRRGDGGTYLVVADDTEEAKLALRYAARLAKSNRGHLSILYIMALADVQQWTTVEAMMRKELREEAEKFTWSFAKRVNDLNGSIPGLWIREGDSHDVLVDVINEDMSIKMLILGGGTQVTGPGPLVSHFTGKGLGRLRVPVVVVPGHLEPQKIDAIS